MELLEMGINEIIGVAGGGGSLFMALISLLIRLIYKRVKVSRYKNLKASLNLIGTKIDVENKGGNAKLRKKLMEIGEMFKNLAQELEDGDEE